MALDKRVLDDLARMTSGAFGAAASLREEAGSQMRERVAEWVYRLDLVPREEFEAMRTVAETARAEQEQLAGRLDALEQRLAALEAGGRKPASTAKSPASAGRRTGRTAAKGKTGRTSAEDG